MFQTFDDKSVYLCKLLWLLWRQAPNLVDRAIKKTICQLQQYCGDSFSESIEHNWMVSCQIPGLFLYNKIYPAAPLNFSVTLDLLTYLPTYTSESSDISDSSDSSDSRDSSNSSDSSDTSDGRDQATFFHKYFFNEEKNQTVTKLKTSNFDKTKKI